STGAITVPVSFRPQRGVASVWPRCRGRCDPSRLSTASGRCISAVAPEWQGCRLWAAAPCRGANEDARTRVRPGVRWWPVESERISRAGGSLLRSGLFLVLCLVVAPGLVAGLAGSAGGAAVVLPGTPRAVALLVGADDLGHARADG